MSHLQPQKEKPSANHRPKGILIALCCANACLAGQVTGKVTASDTRAPLYGVTVFAYLGPPSKLNPPPIYKAATDAGGVYTITGIPDGNYRVCAGHSGSYLDPCVWAQPISATVRGTSNLDIALDPGTPIGIGVQDVAGVVPSSEAALGGPLLGITLTDINKRQLPVPRVSSLGSTHEFAIVVPVGASFKLNIGSNKYKLQDASGKDIAASGTVMDVTGKVPDPPDPSPLPLHARPRSGYGTFVHVKISGTK